jgi:hypothetical protein
VTATYELEESEIKAAICLYVEKTCGKKFESSEIRLQATPPSQDGLVSSPGYVKAFAEPKRPIATSTQRPYLFDRGPGETV